MQISSGDSNVSLTLFTVVAGSSPIIFARKKDGGGSVVRLSYTYMAHIKDKGIDVTAWTERKATCSFIIVGY